MSTDIDVSGSLGISGSFGSVGPVTVNPVTVNPVTLTAVPGSTSLGAIGPVTVAGIPDTYHIYVEKIPHIQIGIDPITVTLNPVDVNVRIKEFPSIRAHIPADFSVGLSLLGMELLTVRLCGEAQVITEPYAPNPCETCREVTLTPLPPNVIDVPPVTNVPGRPG